MKYLVTIEATDTKEVVESVWIRGEDKTDEEKEKDLNYRKVKTNKEITTEVYKQEFDNLKLSELVTFLNK